MSRAPARRSAIGPSPAAESYLKTDAILDAARQTGAEAIHPGYGFLAENPDFADACEQAGIVFIGPRPDHMRAFGLKHRARELALQSEVPVAPGSGLIRDVGHAMSEAARIGYPVMIKSTAGGGGIGLQLVTDARDLAPMYRARRAPRPQQLQECRHLPREIYRARAAYRGADLRRRQRHRRLARRARLLGAAAQSEGHRGDARAKPA